MFIVVFQSIVLYPVIRLLDVGFCREDMGQARQEQEGAPRSVSLWTLTQIEISLRLSTAMSSGALFPPYSRGEMSPGHFCFLPEYMLCFLLT